MSTQYVIDLLDSFLKRVNDDDLIWVLYDKTHVLIHPEDDLYAASIDITNHLDDNDFHQFDDTNDAMLFITNLLVSRKNKLNQDLRNIQNNLDSTTNTIS